MGISHGASLAVSSPLQEGLVIHMGFDATATEYVEPVLYSALACRGVRDLCSSNRHGGRIFSVKASDEAEPAGCNPK